MEICIKGACMTRTNNQIYAIQYLVCVERKPKTKSTEGLGKHANVYG